MLDCDIGTRAEANRATLKFGSDSETNLYLVPIRILRDSSASKCPTIWTLLIAPPRNPPRLWNFSSPALAKIVQFSVRPSPTDASPAQWE